jgi:hypothetical protein
MVFEQKSGDCWGVKLHIRTYLLEKRVTARNARDFLKLESVVIASMANATKLFTLWRKS